ncbi:hypothetical protein E3J79_00630 [Candidatus Dependentiae bacterium]|nr:MAG: hypothetical protein E3J79_00630 [Candidatus Dependentiae bacterium]
MENLISLLEQLSKEKTKDVIIKKIPSVVKEINKLLLKIKECKKIEAANKYFDLLEKIQFVLAKLLYIENIDMQTDLKKFIGDFDRLDDSMLREYLFKEIKENKHVLK